MALILNSLTGISKDKSLARQHKELTCTKHKTTELNKIQCKSILSVYRSSLLIITHLDNQPGVFYVRLLDLVDQ